MTGVVIGINVGTRPDSFVVVIGREDGSLVAVELIKGAPVPAFTLGSMVTLNLEEGRKTDEQQGQGA